MVVSEPVLNPSTLSKAARQVLHLSRRERIGAFYVHG